MTIRSFGRITPLQGEVLTLAGYGPSKQYGVRDLELPDNELDRIQNIRRGGDILKRTTGIDLGYSLADWHEYLLNSEEYRGSYTHPYGWQATQKAVLSAISDSTRERLETLAASDA